MIKAMVYIKDLHYLEWTCSSLPFYLVTIYASGQSPNNFVFRVIDQGVYIKLRLSASSVDQEGGAANKQHVCLLHVFLQT